jgi:glycosyltransferase involved in cell wall biosynthesis
MSVLLIGNYVDEEIHQQRALPCKNAAESNRIFRLAMAFRSAGEKAFIASPATAMRVGWTGKWWHRGAMRRTKGIPIAYSGNIGLPFATVLTAPFSLLLKVMALGRGSELKMVLLYNYDPPTILAGLFCKLVFGTHVILDIEDICKPTFADWIGRGDARPVQQLIGRMLMELGRSMCDRVMIPSRRFVPEANITGDYLVVSGCLSVSAHRDLSGRDATKPIQLLVSGTLDEEQGVYLVLEAIRILAAARTGGRPMRFHLCGFADDESRLTTLVTGIAEGGMDITYHGSLSARDFKELLWETDVCVAMQQTQGRHSARKTPSKVYEYLAHGKIVIATDVGDFRDIPSEVITLCEYNAVELAEKLRGISENWIEWEPRGERAAAYAAAEYSFASVGRRILASKPRDDL